MQQRKSRPNIERASHLHVIPRVTKLNDATIVDKLPEPPPSFAVGTGAVDPKPTAPRAPAPPVAPPNIIPFAKPRAIASMPATFSAPKPTGPTPPPQIGSWNKPKQQPAPVHHAPVQPMPVQPLPVQPVPATV